MSRPKLTTPTRMVKIYLKQPLAAKVDLHLFSEAEGRIPYSAWAKFLEERISDYFESAPLDLATIAPGSAHIPSDTFYVRGLPQALEILKEITKC